MAAARYRRNLRTFRRRSVALRRRAEPADDGGASTVFAGPAPDRLEAEAGRAVRADLRPGIKRVGKFYPARPRESGDPEPQAPTLPPWIPASEGTNGGEAATFTSSSR